MQRKIVNPWTWQDKYGFVQANDISGFKRLVFCAGQTSVDGNGNPLHPGDILAQLNQALDNVAAVLKDTGLDMSHVVRLNIYTTDVPGLLQVHDQLTERLRGSGCRHAGTLLGVARLAGPDMLVEIEVTAAA